MKIKKYIPLFVSVMLLVSVFSPLSSSAAEPVKNRPQLTIGKFDKAPTIDGNVTAAEWGEKSFSIGENQPNVTVFKTEIKDENGKVTGYKPLNKTTTDVYMGWDDTHVYLGVVAKYSDHYALAILGNQLWQDDCIQTKISATERGTQYNDIDFGISSSTGKALAQVWNPTQGGMKYGQLNAGKGKDFMITRKGDVTTYEIAFPIKSFATTVLKLKQNDKIAFSLVQHMSKNDANGNGAGFYEFAGGIVMDKEILKTAVITLGAPKKLAGGNEGGNTSSVNNSGSGSNQGGNTSSGTQGGNNSAVTSNGNSSVTGSNASSDTSDASVNTDTSSSGNSSDNNTDASSSDTAGTDTDDGDEEEKGANTVLIIVIVSVAALAILGAAFYFLILRKR